jgi:hypothetical protein
LPDDIPTGNKAVFAFLEMVALAFAFEGVSAWLNGKPWNVCGESILGSLLFFLAGIKWPWIRHRLSYLWDLVTRRRELGVWPYVAGAVCLIVGAALGFLATLPIWAKVVVGLAAAILSAVLIAVMLVGWRLHQEKPTALNGGGDEPNTENQFEMIQPEMAADQKRLEALRTLLPNSEIAKLRDQPFHSRFPWNSDAALAGLIQADSGPHHGFLDENLEQIRIRLHGAAKLLFDRVHRYSEEASPSGGRGYRVFRRASISESIADYDQRRDEVIEAAGAVCQSYDELVLTARRKLVLSSKDKRGADQSITTGATSAPNHELTHQSSEALSSLRSELELRRGRRNDGITLLLENSSDRTIKGCGITIAMLSRFYEGIGEFIGSFEFTTINLLEPQDLGPGQKSNEVYLAHKSAYSDGHARFGNPETSHPRTVPEPGIWRAELHVFAAPANAYSEYVFFQWHTGTKPDFASNPTLSMD